MQEAAAVSSAGYSLLSKAEEMRNRAYALLSPAPRPTTVFALAMDPSTPMSPTPASQPAPTVSTPPRRIVPERVVTEGPVTRSTPMMEVVNGTSVVKAFLTKLKECSDPAEISQDDLIRAFPTIWPAKFAPILYHDHSSTGASITRFRCSITGCRATGFKSIYKAWTHVAEVHCGQGVKCVLCLTDHEFFNPDGYKQHFRRACSHFRK